MHFRKVIGSLAFFTLLASYFGANAASFLKPMDGLNSATDVGSISQQLEPGEIAGDGSGLIPNFRWNPAFPMDDYELGPGDILNIHFWGAKDLSTKVYVSPSYELFIPGIGAFSVRGLKLKDLNSRVSRNLRKRLGNTFVSISLNRPREFKIFIHGAVPYNTEKSANLMTRLGDFFVTCGGLGANASLTEIVIRNSRLKTSKVINYQSFVLNGDESGNPFLLDGDSIFVPYKKNEVVIKGDVNRPGKFQFEAESMPLKKVVEDYLGGFVSLNHTEGQVAITRITEEGANTEFISQLDFFNSSTPVNYFNFVLKNGDQIYFPAAVINNPAQGDFVYLTGQVQVPGPQKFKSGAPFNTYISAAGGVSSRANYDGIVIYKASGAKLSVKEKVSIDPGDTIFVPEVTFKFWQDHLMILTTFLAVVTTTIAISR